MPVKAYGRAVLGRLLLDVITICDEIATHSCSLLCVTHRLYDAGVS